MLKQYRSLKHCKWVLTLLNCYASKVDRLEIQAFSFDQDNHFCDTQSLSPVGLGKGPAGRISESELEMIQWVLPLPFQVYGLHFNSCLQAPSHLFLSLSGGTEGEIRATWVLHGTGPGVQTVIYLHSVPGRPGLQQKSSFPGSEPNLWSPWWLTRRHVPVLSSKQLL